MNLIIRVQVVDNHGHVVHEKNGEIDNFTGRESFSVISLLKQWIGESVCSLKMKCIGTELTNEK